MYQQQVYGYNQPSQGGQQRYNSQQQPFKSQNYNEGHYPYKHGVSDIKVDNPTSPPMTDKVKDASVLQQQQQYNNYPVRQSPTMMHKSIADHSLGRNPSYRQQSSPISSPTQRYNHASTGFNSDIVAGLTQPNYQNTNSNNNNGGNDLPTLPPLNTSSPQLKNNLVNNNRSRWASDEEKMINRSSLNSMVPTTPDTPHQPQQRQADPSVLVQYPSSNRDDRQLMSPYPQRQQEEAYTNNNGGDVGPYGCGIPNCFASFSASNGLFYHMKNAHANIEDVAKPYRCAMPSCPKRYKNINGLQYHLLEAKGSSGHGGAGNADGEPLPKPYTCQVPGCKKAYRTANGLRYHQVHGHNMQPNQQPSMEQQQQQMHIQQQSQPQLMQQMQAVQAQQQMQRPMQQSMATPQYRMQREKWMNNNI